MSFLHFFFVKGDIGVAAAAVAGEIISALPGHKCLTVDAAGLVNLEPCGSASPGPSWYQAGPGMVMARRHVDSRSNDFDINDSPYNC